MTDLHDERLTLRFRLLNADSGNDGTDSFDRAESVAVYGAAHEPIIPA